jgi:lipid II:glycine glycyltransferase (peptidoglycan interpeptide bridge formation enzyme)
MFEDPFKDEGVSMGLLSFQQWQDFISGIPKAHLLQSPAWGELKSYFGWTPFWLSRGDLGVQILFQKLPLGYQVAYIPRGPVSLSGPVINHPDWPGLLKELDDLCREQKAVFLKMEPDIWMEDLTENSSPFPKFTFSSHSIQPPRTVVVSLEGMEEEILSRMKSKTRYNIRLAAKKGVTVREISSVDPFYDLLEGTSGRADFGIHTREYYQRTFEIFYPLGACVVLLAEFEGMPLASIMVFKSGERSWYFYGASSDQHRQLMPTYLIQWEGMRWAKKHGCISYDLWGVPDEDLESLEKGFTARSDGLWGVYRFKRGFGGELVRTSGPWDRVYNAPIYALYRLRTRFQGGA